MLTAAQKNTVAPASYADRVANALDDFLNSGTIETIIVLAPLLWNSSLELGPRTPEEETVAEAACVKLLRCHDSKTHAATYAEQCVLTGLLVNNRWKKLFNCETDAYAFVVMLIRYLRKEAIRSGGAPNDQSEHRAFRLQVHAALATWMPADITPGDFMLRDLASAFFGEAWCVLVFDGPKRTTLAALIEATKPVFLPGRLTSDLDPDFAPLPDLAC
jgi:hypothetical protein